MSTNHEFHSTMKEKGDGMKKNKKGFTLVEIIVVLVIIGILMALAVPAVMSYVQGGRYQADFRSKKCHGSLQGEGNRAGKQTAAGFTGDG